MYIYIYITRQYMFVTILLGRFLAEQGDIIWRVHNLCD